MERGDAAVAVSATLMPKNRWGKVIVAVMGNVHANGDVHGQIVCVKAGLQFWAERRKLNGDVVKRGGEIIRDPFPLVIMGISMSSLLWRNLS